MIKKMTKFFGIIFVLWAVNLRGVSVACFPGLDELIKKADAIVILRVEKQLTDFGSSTLYTTYECYIYQTLKGDIPAGKRIRLQLMDARTSFVTPYAPSSAHLVFLTRKRSPDEPTDYRSLGTQGANVRISPFGNGKLPSGKSIKEKIQTLLTRAGEYNKKQYEKEQANLNRMRQGGLMPKLHDLDYLSLHLRVINNSNNAIDFYEDLIKIQKFILKQGKTATYCSMYNNNPAWITGGYGFYLNPDTGQANINCDPDKSGFHSLTIQDFSGGPNASRTIAFADKSNIAITVPHPSGDLTVEQIERLVANAVNAIMMDIDDSPKHSVPGLADKLKDPNYAYATRLINIFSRPTPSASNNAEYLDTLKKIIRAERKLVTMGKTAIPALIDNLNRKFPQIKKTAYAPYVERPLLIIISAILDPIGATYKIRRVSDGKSVSSSTYFAVHFGTQAQARVWWNKHKTDSLEKIHRLIRDWYIDRESKLGFKDEEQKQQILGEIQRRYQCAYPPNALQALKNMLWTDHFDLTSIMSLQSRYPEGKELLFRQDGSGREVQTIFPKGIVPPGIDALKSHKFTLHGKIITINEKPNEQAMRKNLKKWMVNYQYFLVSSWTAEPKYKSGIDYIQQTGRLWGISEVKINNDASITLVDAKTGPGRGLMMSLSEPQESATIKPGESCSLKDGDHAAIVYKLQKIEQGKLTFSVTEKFDARSFGKGITTETKAVIILPYRVTDDK
jgi:hypothetical protein